MPRMQSEPDEVHEPGGEDDSCGGKLASVQSEELDEPKDLGYCQATTLLVTENGRIRVHCTMKRKPRHVHYDEIFSKEWQ